MYTVHIKSLHSTPTAIPIIHIFCWVQSFFSHCPINLPNFPHGLFTLYSLWVKITFYFLLNTIKSHFHSKKNSIFFHVLWESFGIITWTEHRFMNVLNREIKSHVYTFFLCPPLTWHYIVGYIHMNASNLLCQWRLHNQKSL